MQYLVIGDIHGCYRELQDLLEKAALAEDDRIIALGDVLDRGPHPLKVVRFFQKHDAASSLYGNHEHKNVRWWQGGSTPGLTQRITRHLIGEKAYPEVCAAVQDWPDRLELPDAYLAHALWEPGIKFKKQRREVLVGLRKAEMELIEELGEQWFAHYDGKKPLIVGHHDYGRTQRPLVVNDSVFCIDTGCCHGGKLTGLLLPSFEFVSVPSRKNYWADLQQQYGHL